MLRRCGGRVLHVKGAFPLLSTLRYNSAVESLHRPTILMILNTQCTCSDVAVVVVHSCMAHFRRSAPFGTTLALKFYNSYNPNNAKHAYQHAPSLRWSCVTCERRISTAQHSSVQLCCRMYTSPNHPNNTKHALHMLGRCGGRGSLVYGAFPMISALWYNSAVECLQR